MRIPFILFVCIFVLAGCTDVFPPRTTGDLEPYSQTVINDGRMMPVEKSDTPYKRQPQLNTVSANGKVALLVPLSGQQEKIGQSLLNAAQIAVFDMRDPAFELMPIDTMGTTQGTRDAVTKAAQAGAKLIIGPLLANNVAEAGRVARQYNLPVIGFTTDVTKVGGNIMTLGILPQDQGYRLAQFATDNNLNRIAVITPQNAYAGTIISAFKMQSRNKNVTITHKIPYTNAVQVASILNQNKGQFDAIMMPIGSPQISALARALDENNLNARIIPWLGAGLWDDATITNNPAMHGAYFASPSPEERSRFERQYRSIYGEIPMRLSSLAYDATALSIILLRQNTGTITRQSIMNPNGFAGIDGIFRFNHNGVPERGLAIRQISGHGQTSIISPAPKTFVN